MPLKMWVAPKKKTLDAPVQPVQKVSLEPCSLLQFRRFVHALNLAKQHIWTQMPNIEILSILFT